MEVLELSYGSAHGVVVLRSLALISRFGISLPLNFALGDCRL